MVLDRLTNSAICFAAERTRDDPVGPVRAVLDRQVVDWNKGDLDGFLAGYWNSPKVVFQSGGQRHDGLEAMRDRYRRRYQAEGKRWASSHFHRSKSSHSARRRCWCAEAGD